MKKITSIVCIILIIALNIYIVSYKYSFFSITSYKMNNYVSNKDNLVVIEEKIEIKPNSNVNYPIIESYEGTMTAYGADCYGCSGITASGYDIRNGNIVYQDKTFGTLRITAADRSIPFGTVVRITGLKVYDEPIFAIVLDRGYLIKGTLMDLAFSSENDELVKHVGRSNVKYDILRYGW